LEKTNDAIYYYKKAININPNYADAHNNLGNALKDSGKFEKAISCYEKAININPNYVQAYYNLGIIFEKLNNFQESINCYKKAIEIKPNYTRAHNNLLFNICWSNKNEKYLEFAKKYYDIIPEFDDNKFIWPNSSNEKILKVGFVSGDFRNHPLGYFLLDTLKNLKKKNLKLFAYSNNKLEDEQTKLLKQYFDSWIVIIHETERNLMNLIRKDNLDILFDLSGHTKNNRLPIFKNRCAPVQATWCGWLASRWNHKF
jgi:predicted O-linked N-acetylglucosamine transferase (SPINDLY family)